MHWAQYTLYLKFCCTKSKCLTFIPKIWVQSNWFYCVDYRLQYPNLMGDKIPQYIIIKHCICLPDDNKVYSWGNSNSGQLGVGTTGTSPHPRPLHLGMSAGTKIRGITCGTRHSFVWTQDGDCFSFGNNYSAQLGYDFRKPDFKENQVTDLYNNYFNINL